MYNCFKKDPSRHFSVAGTVAHRRWNGKEGWGGGGGVRVWQVGTQREQSAPQPEIEIFSLFFLLFGFRLCPRDGRGKGARVVDLVSTTTTSGTHTPSIPKKVKRKSVGRSRKLFHFFFILFVLVFHGRTNNAPANRRRRRRRRANTAAELEFSRMSSAGTEPHGLVSSKIPGISAQHSSLIIIKRNSWLASGHDVVVQK
jgi:hypothetical protein